MPSEMPEIKRFIFDGLLASKEIQDVARSIEISSTPLLVTSDSTEATDPAWYPPNLVQAARRMMKVYYRFYLFENQVRDFVNTIMQEAKGEKWFETSPPPEIRKNAQQRKENEEVARFHKPRGDSLLLYVNLPEFGKIILANWEEFEGILYSTDWVSSKFEELRLTRNAIAHMGEVSDDDLARVDIILRDWNKQVG